MQDEANRERVLEALSWYAEQVAGCRKIGSLGQPFQHALDADGGKRARDALAALHLAAQDTSMVLVPRKPTEAMLLEGQMAYDLADVDQGEEMRAAYHAMLAATSLPGRDV